MADGFTVARTPHTPQRRVGRLLTLLVFMAIFGTACSATPTWTTLESASGIETTSDGDDDTIVPDALAFVDQESDVELPDDAPIDNVESAPAVPSEVFCSTSANIWIHSAALNLLGPDANKETVRIAMANVAEWIERSTLFDEPAGPDHTAMFESFTELQATIETDFAFDWVAFQSSSDYANSDAAKTYEAARSDLVSFLSDACNSPMSDLRSDAEARATELTAEFGTTPSTVVESDSLPGHSIFTHSSGRLIASFPTAWSYEERTGTAIVELVASPDIERFLNGDAIDGVHLQLVEAATIADFRDQLAATMTGATCELTNDLADSGTVRQNITQTFACADHGASVVGQYSDSRGLGLIIEASFDRPEASRADLIRLASIANSALWS